ncbi:MAG: nicotinate phosphoribosyltransferase [Patescibacteria group bacterium]
MKKGKPRLLNHFFLPEDQHLFDYDQIFSVSSMWVDLGMKDVIATYDLSVRGIPKNRNFLLFGGLEEIVEGLLNWRYTKEEVDFLLNNKIITPKMARLMRNFKFKGDIWAMPEGTVFFPGEPVVKITGRIWEINLFTFFLMNALTSNTIFLSKAVRSFLVAAGKINVVTCPVTRAHSNESSLKFGRAVYILGAPSTIVPAFARKFNLPISKVNTKAYHAFIKSFPSELEAMRAAASVFPGIGFMVDTYDFKQGVKNAITVAKELKKKGQTISAVVIDSGKDVYDFIRQARYARSVLDKAGLPNVRVNVSGNFDEWKLAELVKEKAPVNGVVICTELVTSSDDPKLEAVLKLVEYKKGKEVFYATKLSRGKISYPGRKQVFRKYRNRLMREDTIGLEGEKLGKPLLKKMVVKGKLKYKLPVLDQIKKYTKKELTTLPLNLKRIDKQFAYPVSSSKKLSKLFIKAKKGHLEDPYLPA